MLSLRDPVHGFVRADELESALLDSRPMQRLRSIHQLGLASLVFPGAEHSRFSHAVGAMELAGRVYDALAAHAPDLLPPSPAARERRLVRLAALLHDVGHAPFSHSAEGLFEDGLEHEEMTRRLLAGEEIAGCFARHGGGVEPAEVAALLAGGEGPVGRLLAEVVSGALDVDKMDYLLRDSLYCGVRYGSYDLDRLLDTLRPLPRPDGGGWGIGVDEGGVHAVEALVMARYYMFTQVYFNPTSKALELHLNEWLREVDRRWPADPESFLGCDDVEVTVELRRSGSRHARSIVERRHDPLAFETGEHLSGEERRRFQAVLADAAGELSGALGPGELLVAHSAKDPHRLEASGVLVRHRDGRLEPLADASQLLRHLVRIERFRVYAPAERRPLVAAAIGRRWRESGRET
ncbi:MAG TPA: HD domain-containing protein [Thermoanaerobaculia bacterium]|nr:HD domain-containing protein [Thermoanaerobaculia bacterium]